MSLPRSGYKKTGRIQKGGILQGGPRTHQPHYHHLPACPNANRELAKKKGGENMWASGWEGLIVTPGLHHGHKPATGSSDSEGINVPALCLGCASTEPGEAEQLLSLELDKLWHITSSVTVDKVLNFFRNQFALLYNGGSTCLLSCGELNHIPVSASKWVALPLPSPGAPPPAPKPGTRDRGSRLTVPPLTASFMEGDQDSSTSASPDRISRQKILLSCQPLQFWGLSLRWDKK